MKHEDPRGFFSEAYSRRAFAEAGIEIDFVQDNHVLSEEQGTVRGLHFQIPPSPQAKLVRVTRGAYSPEHDKGLLSGGLFFNSFEESSSSMASPRDARSDRRCGRYHPRQDSSRTAPR